MKIVIATPLYPPDLGGCSAYAQAIATRLSQRATAVVVAYANAPEPVPGVRVVATRKTLPLFLRLPAYAFRLWNAAKGADALYVLDGAAVGAPAALVARWRGIPLLRRFDRDEAWERARQHGQTEKGEAAFAHAPEGTWKTRLIARLQAWVLREARLVLASTASARERLVRLAGLEGAKARLLLPPPARLARLAFAQAAQPGLFVALGGLETEAERETVLQAFAKTTAGEPHARLVILQDGPGARACLERAALLGMERHVNALERASRAETSHWLQMAHGLLLPCAEETSAPILALARAIPVPTIAADTADHRAALLPNWNLVPPSAIGMWTEAMRAILKQEPTQEKDEHGEMLWEEHTEELLQYLGGHGQQRTGARNAEGTNDSKRQPVPKEATAALEAGLRTFGYALEEDQPHTGGERQVISNNKLVLLGRRTADGQRVVIKASLDEDGVREIERERACRASLHRLKFAYGVFFTPEEVGFFRWQGQAVLVTAFIEQDRPFLERSLEEQFFLALLAFEAQEGAHAATYEHAASLKNAFAWRTAADYLERFAAYGKSILEALPHRSDLARLWRSAAEELQAGRETIARYGGFLVHADFVPHNVRIVGRKLYLLDHSSLCFGNKYEGWARFLNFMALHHPALETALEAYVRANRSPEEAVALRLMRLYRLGELVWYYANRLGKTAGDLQALDAARVEFWKEMLAAALAGTPIAPHILAAYKETRDRLRSAEEQKRQRGLH